MAGAKHPTPRALRDLARRGETTPGLRRHVDACERCREDLRLAVVADEMEAAAVSLGACPESDELVAFADGTLLDDARRRVEAHVSGCDACAVAAEVTTDARGARALPGLPAHPARARSAGWLQALRDLATFEMPPALALSPRSTGAAEAGLQAAMAAYRDGDHERALEGLQALVDGGDASPAVHHFLGACLAGANRLEEAVGPLETAARKRSDLPGYSWALAQVLLLLGRGEEALLELQRCARRPGAHRAAARRQVRALREILGRD